MGTSEQDVIARLEQQLVILARRLRNGAGDIYKDNGLTFVEYSLLSIIDTQPGITARGLADAAQIDKSTASRQLAALRTRGLVLRGGGGRSGPGQVLTLSPTGARVLTKVRRLRDQAITRRVETWPAGEVEQLVGLLRRYNRG